MKSCTALNFAVLLILAIHLKYASANVHNSASVQRIKPVPGPVNLTGVVTADAYCSSDEGCSETSPCCKKEGETEGMCCDQKSMACCGESIGCATPCPSQFEAVPCEEETAEELSTQAVDIDCPNRLQTRILYRTTYPGQNCYGGGLKAKNPQATRTVASHVGCGSRSGYTSQYISLSTSLDVMLNKYYPNASPGSRIVKVDLDRVPLDCKTYDLTLPMNRAKWLGHHPRAEAWAKSDCEVLLACESRVPCTTIVGPKADEATEFQDNPPEVGGRFAEEL